MPFNFSTLPNELKNSVLDLVQLDDSPKFLQASKQLRTLVLLRGGFPKRIDDKIVLDFWYSSPYEQDCPKLVIEVTRHFKELFKASIDEKKTVTIDGYKAKNRGEFFWNLLGRKISMCRMLMANFGCFYQDSQEVKIAEKFTRNFVETYGQVLPNVKSYQHVELFGASRYALMFLEHFQADFVENLKFMLHWEKKKTLNSILAHQAFQRCQVLTWNTASDRYKMELISKVFADTSSKYLVVDFECIEKLRKLWKVFGKQGIPERNGQPGVVVIKHDGIDEDDAKDDFNDLTNRFAQSFGLKRITANTHDAIVLRGIFEGLSTQELDDALPATFNCNEIEWGGKRVVIKKKPRFRYLKKVFPNNEIFVSAVVLINGTETYGACEMQVLMTMIRNGSS